MSSFDSKDSEDSGGGSERWLVSYADFITLMFAFFAVLYATSEKDMKKSKEFQDSIKKYLIKAGAFGDTGQQAQQGNRFNTVVEPPIETFADKKPEAVPLLDQIESSLEAKFTPDERKKYILDVTSDDWGVRITVSSAPVFSGQSDKFSESALPFINKLSRVLADSKRKVLIEGHVASGETGGRASTWDFSSARAVNLLRYLERKEGLASSKLVAAAFADSRPLSNSDSGVNSRLEIVLLTSDLDL